MTIASWENKISTSENQCSKQPFYKAPTGSAVEMS